MELTADKAEAGLGGSSVYLVYTYFLYKALQVPTRVILNYHSQYYIRLAYTINIRRYIYLPLLLVVWWGDLNP